ncbi:3 beta-hydroxysteroid dehydrogenase/Delta 5--_4-isomerase [Rubripirellula lacrimiformis]|uniref:3 beta-hydroxysteroid dehydrogenase/Delta 5-->4-isomerase n=1 Tax=Rubripirellula lacrimiformis TaxID=1930273 RepID=A0A517N9M4_9BACT|nr:SDR family NAD(P)-dependent oxidoreductase [Rubripirellula lacrimiformis]QDT03831.1 3 beta-hydroxysteroid dehydrogenase/Delta 5-->4-isomerase [Rubripirellula lacrimiformis]
MNHALITGATGFIGRHLVERLIDRGQRVTCLARPHSNTQPLVEMGAEIATGDVTDRESIGSAMREVDVVYHLAGMTKGFRRGDFDRVNEQGTDNVASVCHEQSKPPVMVLVSSLAAAGPTTVGNPRTESDPAAPVSIYGFSKLAGEQAAIHYADKVPLTIVRPPIVLGEGDHDGFAMFDSIGRWGVHAVPNWTDDQVSVIDAKDLCAALAVAADSGTRVSPSDPTAGIYFAANDETPTYAELGRMIGRSMGRNNVFIARIPPAMMWTVAGISDLAGRIRRRPNILNWDKAREATSGSWTCSARKLRTDTGFQPAAPFAARLAQTTAWYIENGWMKAPVLRPRHSTALEHLRSAGQNSLRDS